MLEGWGFSQNVATYVLTKSLEPMSFKHIYPKSKSFGVNLLSYSRIGCFLSYAAQTPETDNAKRRLLVGFLVKPTRVPVQGTVLGFGSLM